jgi:hypothetical protein
MQVTIVNGKEDFINHVKLSTFTIFEDPFDTNRPPPLAALYKSVAENDLELAKFVLAPNIYGLENLLEAIADIFDNYMLSKEIFEFLDWKIKKDDFQQKNIQFVYGRWGRGPPKLDVHSSDDTFGIGKQILHYALEKNQTDIAILLISSVQEINVNCWYHVRKRAPRTKGGWTTAKKYLFQKALEDEKIDVLRALVKHKKLDSTQVFSTILESDFLDENPDLQNELILSLLNQDNLDFVKVFEKCVSTGNFELFEILVIPKYLAKAVPWVEGKALLSIIKSKKIYLTMQWIELFLENANKLKINIYSKIHLHSTEILKHCSYHDERPLIKFLVDTLKFKVTEEVIKYAKRNKYDPNYESDSWSDDGCPGGWGFRNYTYIPPRASEELIRYLESKVYIPCKAPSPKRQKLK